jgi:uncharacterized membrane protein YbhN (UPF0104 family)
MILTARLQKFSFVIPLVKGVVLFLTLYYLYQSLVGQKEGAEDWLSLLLRSWQGEGRGLVLAVILLIPVNWGLEAWKWRLLARKVEKMPYGRAYRAVMAGLCLGFITPNRVGDYAGRILALRSSKRTEAVGAVFLGRISQMLVTLSAGSLSLFYLSFSGGEEVARPGLFGAAVATALLAILLFCGLLFSRHLLQFFHRASLLRPFRQYVSILGRYSPAELGKVLLLSGGRYGVFGLQFGLLLYVFGLRFTWEEGAVGIAGTYLLKSVLPSFNALSDLGLREVSAIYFFGFFGHPHLPVLSASLSLWLLNLGLPTAIGLFFVMRLKVRA